jgi:hypothetical protein
MSALLDKVARRVGAPPGLTLRRTYAGHVQRSQGAWSWWAEDGSGREVLAGYVSLTELARAPALTATPCRHCAHPVLEIDPA